MINTKETVFDLAYKGVFDPLKQQIEENPELIFKKDPNERCLIHWAALGGFQHIVKYLLQLDSEIDPVDDIGMTPLILAASANRQATVDLLVDNGANVNAKNHQGHSAMQYAASKGWKQVLDRLIQSGGDVNIKDERGATPLHRAASKDDANIVSTLLNQGSKIEVNAVDAYGNTPLHLACEENNFNVAKILVQHQADPTILNKRRETPLDLATPELARTLRNMNEM